jgi:acetyltransferase-like isoleucine patch superfamily enzyme
MSSLRRSIALGSSPAARAVRATYRGLRNFHLPAPRVIVRPLLLVYLAGRAVWSFLFRVFVSEPLFKASCTRYGRNLRAGNFVPWVSGGGDILIGDNCNIVGKLDIAFAARFSDRPTLEIGNDTGIGHLCSFVVAKRITIGSYCHIAGGTRMFDSSGHPLDPVRRREGHPPDEEDVKPITIGDNVWIGGYSVIFPGVTIGDNSVVATGSVVTGDVPPNTFVAGYPARMIRRFE